MRQAEAFIGRGDAFSLRFRYLVRGAPLDLAVTRLRLVMRARISGIDVATVSGDTSSEWFTDFGGGEYLFTVPGTVIEAFDDAAAIQFNLQVDRGNGNRTTILAGALHIGIPYGGNPLILTGTDGIDDSMTVVKPANGVATQDGDGDQVVVVDASWMEESW